MSETQNIEYKQSWRDAYLKWVCGFANAEGGRLVIGRNDRGEPVGIKDAHRLLDELPNKIRDVLGIIVDVNLNTEGDKELLEICVEAYPNPVSYKGEYFYRSGSTNQRLKGAALDRFLLGKTGRHWDGVPLPHVSLSDLDAQAMTEFRSRAVRSERLSPEIVEESDRALVEKLRLKEGDYLKRAAALLFHPDPEQFITGAFVKIGYFRTNADVLYHDEIHGNLFTQVETTLDLLLTKYLKALISYEGIQRVETFPVPREALREAVLNAVVHRDYAVPTPIQIRVHDGHLSIWNPGILPENWSEATLLEPHASVPYNPDIANAFFRAGDIEAWGRGIQRVFDVCREAKMPPPTIRVEPGEWWFKFPFSTDYLKNVLKATTQETTLKTTLNTTQKVLEILERRPTASRREIAEILQDITEDGVKYQLDKLKKAGTIRHVGPARGGRWEILKDNE